MISLTNAHMERSYLISPTKPEDIFIGCVGTIKAGAAAEYDISLTNVHMERSYLISPTKPED